MRGPSDRGSPSARLVHRVRDKAEAKKTVSAGAYDKPELLTESSNRTAAARIEGRSGRICTQYANMDSGFDVVLGGFTSTAAAKAFLQRASLL